MLTKSDLASFRQCPRKLWPEHHRRDLIHQGDATTWLRANDGNIVGAKARELLGVDASCAEGGTGPASAAKAAICKLSVTPESPLSKSRCSATGHRPFLATWCSKAPGSDHIHVGTISPALSRDLLISYSTDA
jgi:hypothetical protein